jgi:hypothetical protein
MSGSQKVPRRPSTPYLHCTPAGLRALGKDLTDGKGLESHWQKTGQALLVGVILHALYKARNGGTAATLPAVDALLADPDRDIAELWMEMRTYGHIDGENHPAVGSRTTSTACC